MRNGVRGANARSSAPSIRVLAVVLVSMGEPRDPDPVPDCEPSGVGAERVDDPHDLVTGHGVVMRRRQITFREVQIGAAHAGGQHPDPQLPVGRLGHRARRQEEGPGPGRTRFVDHPGRASRELRAPTVRLNAKGGFTLP